MKVPRLGIPQKERTLSLYPAGVTERRQPAPYQRQLGSRSSLEITHRTYQVPRRHCPALTAIANRLITNTGHHSGKRNSRKRYCVYISARQLTNPVHLILTPNGLLQQHAIIIRPARIPSLSHELFHGDHGQIPAFPQTQHPMSMSRICEHWISSLTKICGCSYEPSLQTSAVWLCGRKNSLSSTAFAVILSNMLRLR